MSSSIVAGVGSRRRSRSQANGAGGDLFGDSVAVNSSTIVVGRFGGVILGLGQGPAYVFERQGVRWVETQNVKNVGLCQES
jgi:FG-GAP repeat